MRKIPWLLYLPVLAMLILPDDSQAFFRRRAQFCPPVYRCLPVCPCVPVFVYPSVVPPARPVIVTPKGRRLTVIDAGEQSPFVEVARSRITGRAKPKADFDGHDRGSAKTSIADAAVEAFPDLRALLATLPTDDAMRSLGISKEWESDRVAQEKRNVEVSAYIYAVKFEDDHDYHVIVGTDPSDADPVFFNVEISGLPEEASPYRGPLAAVRSQFENYFTSLGVTLKSSYVKFPEGIPVRLRGSLFFDVDHAAGVVGPQGMRPQTAWEIHPVTAITFEQ